MSCGSCSLDELTLYEPISNARVNDDRSIGENDDGALDDSLLGQQQSNIVDPTMGKVVAPINRVVSCRIGIGLQVSLALRNLVY